MIPAYRQCLRLWFSILILVVLMISLLQAAENKPSINEKRMEATVCIGTIHKMRPNPIVDPAMMFIPRGTGLLVGIPDDPQRRVGLVTAKHVFNCPAKNWHSTNLNLRITWNQHLPLDKYHGVEIKIRQDNEVNWISLSKSDLAAFPMTMPPNLIGKDIVFAVKPSEIVPLKHLVVGQPVTVLGFPGVVGLSLGYSFMTVPIARRNIIAWLLTSEDMPHVILVDKMAFIGNSGGPVFNEPRYWDKYGNGIEKASTCKIHWNSL